MVEIEISLDRLTVIGHDSGGFGWYLKDSGYVSFIGISKNYGFNHAYKGLQGELIEFSHKGKVRIDFNPNKADMEQITDIFSRIKYPHLTRMDIAVDYFGIDLSMVEWISKKRRKRNIWLGENGKLETLYIGAPSSDKRFRIYNKALERLEKGEERDERAEKGHWRVEVQKRYKESDNILETKDYFLQDLFDIRPVSKELDLSHIEKTMDRLVVAGLLERPSELMELSKNARPKYKKLIQEARERAGKALEIEPHEVYEKEKSHLIGKLDDLMSNCFKPMQLA